MVTTDSDPDHAGDGPARPDGTEGWDEQTMSLWRVNLIALVLLPFVTAVLAAPFVMLWGYEPLNIMRFIRWEYLFLVALPGLVAHEVLHGAGWALFTSKGFGSVQFGFKWAFLTPYCHCKEPLKVPYYAFGAGLPLIVLSLVPAALATGTGSGGLLIFGVFFGWAAGGDLIALYRLARLDSDLMVADHPEEMGFFIGRKGEEGIP